MDLQNAKKKICWHTVYIILHIECLTSDPVQRSQRELQREKDQGREQYAENLKPQFNNCQVPQSINHKCIQTPRGRVQ